MDNKLNRMTGVADGTVNDKIKRLSRSTPITSIRRDENTYDLIPTAVVPVSDNYSFAEWSKDAFTDWNITRNDINFETQYGKYTSAEQDKKILDDAAIYVNLAQSYNNAEEGSFEKDNLFKTMHNYKDAYNKLASGDMALLSESTDLNFNKRTPSVQKDQIAKYKTQIQEIQNNALTEADEYAKNAEYWKNKHKLSDYYTAKQLSSNMDLTDLDTYLFKVPNLLGSSASSIKSQIMGTIAAGIAAGGATALAAGITAGSGGLAAPAATVIAGAGASLASNIYSRSEESYAEVYSNYKTKVRQNAEKAGVFDKVIANAKQQLLEANTDNKDYKLPDDDKILNNILSDQVKSGNEKFDDIRVKSLNGLESLYTDNMALSGWDATEQILQVMPFGAIAKVAKGTGALAKTIGRGAKAIEKTKGIKKAMVDKINDVVTFGIDKTAKNLGKMTLRNKLVDIGGRVALTGIMEGAEEGVQYIKGQQYINDEYDTDPNLAKSWVRNLGTGGRAIYAALTPWDSIYSDDKEFMENFKGGAILGGLTTGVVAPIVGYKSISNDVAAADLVGSLYADKTADQDLVDKSIEYARQAKNGNEDVITNAFDRLKDLKIEDLDADLIEQERKRAKQIMSATVSEDLQLDAIKLHIDPRTEDYNVFVALDSYYTNAYKEASKRITEKRAIVGSILSSYDDFQSIAKDIILQKQYSISTKKLIESIERDKSSLNNIAKKHNISTSTSLDRVLTNLKQYSKAADDSYRQLLKDTNRSLKDQDVSIPVAIQTQLHESVSDVIFAAVEQNIVVSDRWQFLNSPEFTIEKINAYKDRIKKDQAFTQQLQNETRGVVEPTTVHEVEQPITDPIPVTVAPAPAVVEPAPTIVEEKPTIEQASAITEVTLVEVEQQKSVVQQEEVKPQVTEPQIVESLGQHVVEQKVEEKTILDDALAPLRQQIIQSRQKQVETITQKTSDKQAYFTRRKYVNSFDTRTDEELGLTYTVHQTPAPNTKAGKAYDSAGKKLEEMYSTLQYVAGPLKYGYKETDAYNQLQNSVEEENTNDWYELKSLKDQLEEAVFDSEPNVVIEKLSNAVATKIDQITTKQNNTEQAALQVREQAKPIEEKIKEVTPTTVEVQERVAPSEAPAPEPNVVIEPVESVINESKTEQEVKPLTYDPRIDKYSHQVNYMLTSPVRDAYGKVVGREEKKFQGQEDAEVGSSFGEISAKEDLFTNPTASSQVVVKPYVNAKGETSDAIYIEYMYEGKKYVAAVTDPNSLSMNYGFNRESFANQQVIRKNLEDLRGKVMQLNEQTKKNPNLKIVPTGINRTNGIVQNAKDESGAPINRKLTDTRFGIKDPYNITPDNTKIGVVTGPLGNRMVRFGTENWRANGSQMGTAVWRIQVPHPNEGTTKNLDVHLNPKTFKNSPKVVDFVYKMMTATSDKYVTEDGVETPFYPQQLLRLVVNYGSHTAVDPNDSRLTEDQIQAKMLKQFYYNEAGDVVLGNNTYTTDELLTDANVQKKVKQHIQDNMHWSVDSDNLWKYFAGADTLDKGHPLGALKSWFELNRTESLTIIPGEIEFALKDVGLEKDGNRVTQSKTAPSGISMVGWYIKNGILLTDAKDELKDALLYVNDVALVDTTAQQQAFEAKDKLDAVVEKAVEAPIEKRPTVSFDDIFAELGPHSEIEPDDVFSPTVYPETSTEWLTQHLDLAEDQVKIVPDVIEITKAGMSVMGKATQDAIYLSSLAPEGTQFHEAWHRVSNLLISEKDRKKVFRKFQGTEQQIDEQIAEEFRQYMMDEAPRIDYTTTNWFKKVYNFIKTWSKVGNGNLAKIYYNINTGKYKNAKVNQANIDRFQKLYGDQGANFEMNGTSFDNIPNLNVYNNIMDGLEYALLRLNKIYFYEDISNLDFNTLKEAVDSRAESSPIFKEISEKFESNIKPNLVSRISNLNIRAIEKQSKGEVSDIDAGEVDNANIGEHTIASYQVSKIDNAPAEVKFFFQTIPAYKYDENGKKAYDTEKFTGFPKFINPGKAWNTVLNDLHGAKSIYDIKKKVAALAANNLFYDSINNKLDLVFHGLQNADAKIRTQSEVLLTRIENTIRSHKHNFTTGKIDRNDDGTISIKIIDNTVDIKSRAYPGIWSQSMFYNRKTFDQAEDGTVNITKTGLADINRFINVHNKMVDAFRNKKGMYTIGGNTIDLKEDAQLDRFKSHVVALFNSIGIEIDKPTIDDMLMSGDYGNPVSISQYQLVNNFITGNANYGGIQSLTNLMNNIKDSVKSDNKINLVNVGDRTTGFKEIRPIELYNNRGFVKVLAQAYSRVHLNTEELKSLGAEGNMLYPISQNNFATDRVSELNEDIELVNKLRVVEYNKGSLILEHLTYEKHAPITIETFVNFRDSSSQDQGRDYFGITDREDYISKLSMVLSDRILFPTVADKKTYHVLRGIKLPHDRISWFQNSKGMTAMYGDETISRFDKYAADDLAAVELWMQQMDDTLDANGNHNPNWLSEDRRIKNYHTTNRYQKDGTSKTIEGNGSRFRFVTGVYLTIDGKEKFINFNDPKKSAKENLKTAKDYFFGDTITPQMRKGMISTLISRAVKKEVDKALSLGLITSANGTNAIFTLKNALLDDAELKTRADYYQKSGSPYVKQNAAAYAIYDMLADYTTNSIISIMEIEKIFSGDPAYYKWNWSEEGVTDMSIDKIKRLGALTSTGLNNRLDFGTDFIRPTYNVAELKDYEIGSPQFDQLEQLFIKGSIKDALIEMEGLSPEEADAVTYEQALKDYPEAAAIAELQAKSEVAGYKKGINVADAAVYVSPVMYRDMMRMIGQWSPEIEEAFNILTDPTKEDLWESDPKLYAKVMKASLKPLKYMAFGNRLDEIPGLAIPYFNKMALFPLFKSIATGDMKPLYDRMTGDNPLDMVMFNSAVKAGSRGAMNYYKDGSVSNLNNLVVYNQEFKYLRQQLATDPHTHEEQMAGTQMLKVAMSNLRLDAFYGDKDKVSGQEVRDRVFNAMNKLSNIGKAKLQSELFTENGDINITALGKMLQDDAKDSGANDNVISGLATKTDAFVMPLSALSDNSWIESRFISMINKATIDINLPGGAFIQRSTFGLEATSQSVISDSMLNNGKRLNLLNEDGSMDAIVSINLFKHIIPNYKKLTFTQAKQWLIDEGIIGVNAEANAIGYRIPTQSVASISALKFVDVLPELMGDTVVLPEEFTKLTGSDFDVDKLYISRYQYEVQETASDDILAEEGATVSKTVKSITNEENRLKNEIVEMYLKILQTRGNTNELKMSIDNATENVKDVLADIESNKTTRLTDPFEVYTPSYQEDRKAEYTGGKSGIGPMALNNAHHILTQLIDPKIDLNAFTETLQLTDLNRISDYPVEGMLKGGRILDWLSAMINAFVDIAKDPYIVRLNVNPWTYNMTAFLLRTGKGKQAFYFMSQPILKEMADEVAKTKGKYGVDQTRTSFELEQEAIDKVLDKYDPTGSIRKSFMSIKTDEERADNFKDLFQTYKDYAGNITSKTRELLLHPEDFKNFGYEQIRMYYAFKTLKPYAQDLANLVKYSKVDTKRMGKSFAEQRTFYNGLSQMKENSKFKPGEVDRFFKESFLQTKLENSITFGQSIFNSLLVRNTRSFLGLQDSALYKLGKYANANDKLLGAIIKSMEESIKSRFFNDRMEKRGNSVTKMLYGKATMAKRLLKFRNLIHEGKYPDLLNADGTIANDLLEYLLPNISTEADQADYIDTSSIFADDKLQADNFINYWRELFESKKPEIARFAEDLVDYAFITSGDNNNLNSFFNYLPNSWRTENGYSQYMQEQTDMFNSDNAIFNWKDLFLNNWFNDDMVKAVREEYPIEATHPETGMPVTNYTSFYSIPTNYILPGTDRTVPQVFIGEMVDKKGYKGNINAVGWKKVREWSEKLQAYTVNSYPIFPPFVKIKVGQKNVPENFVMYELVGYREFEDKQGIQRSPAYAMVTKKGMKFRGHVITEYGRSTTLPFNAGAITYNGLDAITSGEVLKDIYRSKELSEEYKKTLYSMFKQVKPITKLQSYNMGNAEQIIDEENKQDELDTFDTKIQYSVEEETTTPTPVVKIISGGQTGIDRLGLEVGKELGIETGGTTTPGFYTEKGRDESLKEYGIQEVSADIQAGKTGKEFYLPRTNENTKNSDGTVYFSTTDNSAGMYATKRFAIANNKPFLLNPDADTLRKWVNDNNIKVLNVAGNRGSKTTKQWVNQVRSTLVGALSSQNDNTSEKQTLIKQYLEGLELILDARKDLSDQAKVDIRQNYQEQMNSFVGTKEELKNSIIKFICSI